jgi:hypothetical protein
MAKARQGVDFPIVPEDLIYAEDDLCPKLFMFLLFTRAMGEMIEKYECYNSQTGVASNFDTNYYKDNQSFIKDS